MNSAHRESAAPLAALVEAGSKATLALLGVIYALGLVIVTLHLGRYSVPALGLARPQYILAGVWAFLPPAIVAAIVAVVSAMAFNFYDKRLGKSPSRARRILVAVAGLAYAAFGAFGFLSVATLMLSAWASRSALPRLGGS